MHLQLDDIDLFIFDWDGTLSTSTFIVRLSHYFKSRYRLDSLERYLAGHAEDEGMIPNVELRNMDAAERKNSFYSRFYELYALIYKPRLKRNAVDVLKFLKAHKKKVAIFSDGKTDRLFKEIRDLDISKYIDIVLAADYIKRYKPDPTGIKLIERQLGVSKERSIYIGDMAVDIAAAKLAGTRVCSICDGIDPCEKLKKMNPDYIMRNLEEFYKELAIRRS
ncbi:MAG: HAD family hydrolase [Candidatus Micrarchaeia archaeon]